MRRGVSLFTVLFVSSNLVYCQNTESTYSAEAVRSDVDYLYQSLQTTHYDLFGFTSKAAYDAHVEQLKNTISADSLSQLEAVSIYQNLVRFANTGHCEIDFPAQSYIEYAYAGGTVFPLELAFENGTALVRKNYSLATNIALGDELISIDNRSIADIQQQLYNFVSAERTYFKNAKIEFWSFPRLFFQLQGKKNNWTVRLKNSKGEMYDTDLAAISVIEYESNRTGELVNPQQQLTFYANAAYLNPGAFSSIEPQGEQLFKQYIDSAFVEIKAHKTKNLIIDLRNNPGGDNAFSDYLIAYFATKPFRWYSHFTVKTSAILKKQVLLQTDTTDRYSQAILTAKNGQQFAYDFPIQRPVKKTKRFRGEVYILVNRQTYSMAVVSAALIQDYHFGKIVGEETGDVPTLYASQFSYVLPQTGITVKVPKGYIVRANGNTAVEGVQPTIVIQDHLLDEQDEILEGILLLIGNT